MFLSEYYLAIGGDPLIQRHLRKLYAAIRYSQMGYGGRVGGSLDDPYGGPYYWNHAGLQAEKFGAYPHMGVMNANAILTFALMQRCGIAIDPVNLNRTQGLIESSSIDGGMCYGFRVSAGDGFGRTGTAAVAYHMLNNRPDGLAAMGGWLGESSVNENIYFRSHYTPMIGQTWGLLGTYLTNPKAFRKSMQYFKWSFILNHHYNGGFVRCTNLYAYMYYHPSKSIDARSAWIGGSEFQALFYALAKQNLAVTGGKLHVMGVDRHNLPPELAKAFGLMEQQQFQDAYQAIKRSRVDRKAKPTADAMLAFIVKRANMSIHDIKRLKNRADLYRVAAQLEAHKRRFADIGGHAGAVATLARELTARGKAKEIAIGRKLYGILERPPSASQSKAIAELTAFVDQYPQSPYVDMALVSINRKQVSESIPEDILAQMERMRNRGDLYELSRRMPVYRYIFKDNPDYRQRFEEHWRLVSNNDAEVKIGREWFQLLHRLRYDKARKTDKYVEFREKELTTFAAKYKKSPYAKLAMAELKTTTLNWYRTRGSTNDDAMIGLQRMTHLTGLDLATTSITNEGVKRLAPLTALTHLDVSDSGVRPGVIENLRPFTRLTHLSLSHMVASDMAALDKLKLKLLDLSLDRCWHLKDEGMKYVGKWTTLESLNLRGTGVGDRGLGYLKSLRLKKLVLIYLKGGFTDQGLAQLRGMTSLEHLDLSFNSITDEGLKHLTQLKHLKHLDLTGTNVTWAAVRELREALGSDTTLFVKKI